MSSTLLVLAVQPLKEAVFLLTPILAAAFLFGALACRQLFLWLSLIPDSYRAIPEHLTFSCSLLFMPLAFALCRFGEGRGEH